MTEADPAAGLTARVEAVRAKRGRKSQLEPFNGADPAKFDHDGDGAPGGSLSEAEMLERAKAQRESQEAALQAEAQRQAAERVAKAGVDAPEVSARAVAAEAAIIAAGQKARAARAAVDGAAEDPLVEVRITKLGDGKVSMGQHVPPFGEAHYAWKEQPSFPRSIAKALEDRGFVEIL